MPSVKGIFITLACCIIIPPITFFIIEMFNMNVSSGQLQELTKMAARQSCELFAQETYKTDGNSQSKEAKDLVNEDGGFYVTGDFYNLGGGGHASAEVYQELYTTPEFRAFCDRFGDTYKSLRLIRDYAELSNDELSDIDIYSLSDEESLGYTYRESMYTPLNMGVPYMDETVLNKMFQWHLTQLLSNCDPDLIQDGNEMNGATVGDYFVNYKGFQVYCDEAVITNDIYNDYTVYNINDAAQAEQFEELTGIDPQNLVDDYNSNTTDSESLEEASHICVFTVHYKVPVNYIGITPVKNAYEYVWNYTVDGYDGHIPDRTGSATWGDNRGTLDSSASNQEGVWVPGELVYYIVR